MSDRYLNVGCGAHPLAGFLNIDVDAAADFKWDVTAGLPFDDASVDGIFSEHFLEHLSQGQGVDFLRECRRVLRPGGVARIAMPDLDALVRRYGDEDWRGDGDMFRLGYEWVDNRCEMLNICMREWGHQWVYNEEELVRIAQLAGLEVLGRRGRDEGADPRMRGLEYRNSSRLIMEFRPLDRAPATAEPLVSVLIPAYKPEFFAEALDSALAQTYRKLEIVICDDSSGTVIEDIARRAGDARIHYIRNAQRQGPRYNYVACLSRATGDYIKYLNDDDRLHPGCIARLLDCFRREPRLRLATSRRKLIDAAGRPLRHETFSQGLAERDSIIEGRSLARFVVETGINRIGEPSTALFRRDDALQIRPHPFSLGGQELPGIGDVALWLNLLSRGDCAYLTEALSDFRLHAAQHQRSAELGAVSGQSWQRLRQHAQRLGLLRQDGPLVLHMRPPGSAGWRSFTARDRQDAGGPTLDLKEVDRDAQRGEQAYAAWCRRHMLSEADAQIMAERMVLRWQRRPSLHVLAVLRDTHPGAAAATLTSLVGQLYQGWGLTVLARGAEPPGLFDGVGNAEWIDIDGQGIEAAANRAIAQTGADWITVIDAGDRFAAHGLFALADYINLHPEWRAIYSDGDVIADDGRRSQPSFYPDFNLELLRSRPYFGNACLLQRSALDAVGGLRPLLETAGYDAVLRIVETYGETAIGHIADVLFHRAAANVERYEQPAVHQDARRVVSEHLWRSGVAAAVAPGLLPGSHMIEYRHDTQPLVSIIVSAGDRLDALESCVEGLLSMTGYPHYELLVVGDPDTAPDARAFLEALSRRDVRVRVLHCPDPGNPSALNNFAARAARGDYLLLLGGDTEVVQGEWLGRMMAHAQRPEVGVVGARLVQRDGRIQHAGLVLGLDGGAGRVHADLPANDSGYLGRVELAQYVAAVTAACLLIRRDVYSAAGGLDERHFTGLFNDVDLCLKVAERGYKVVWTPFATLMQRGPGGVSGGDRRQQASMESAAALALIEKWGPRVGNDPAYNRNLALHDREPAIEADIVPGWNCDFHERQRILVIDRDPTGASACGAAMRALRDAVLAQVTWFTRRPDRALPGPFDLLRLSPDALVVRNLFDDGAPEALNLYRRIMPALKIVLVLDEAADAAPRFTGAGAADRDRHIDRRRAMLNCDRLIVSTAAQAEGCAGLAGGDIVVMPGRPHAADGAALEAWLEAVTGAGRAALPRERLAEAGT